MIKIISRVHTDAKMPFSIAKGSVKERSKMAEKFSCEFFEEMDKHSYKQLCTVDDFKSSLRKVLPHKAEFNVKQEPNSNFKGTLNPYFSIEGIDNKTSKMTCCGFEFMLPLDDEGSIIIDKYCASHEVRHFFDHLFNPKMSLTRFTNQYNNKSFDTSIDKVRDMFFYDFEQPVVMKFFKNDVRKELAPVSDEIAIDVLQKIRYQLKSEINAYKDEMKFLKKGLGRIKNFFQIIRLKTFLSDYAKFEKKLEFTNILLKERLTNVRIKNKELLN